MVSIEFAAPAVPSGGALALLAMEGAAPAGLWAAADAATGGAIGRAAAAGEFTGKKGQTVTVLAPGAGLAARPDGRAFAVAVGAVLDWPILERRLAARRRAEAFPWARTVASMLEVHRATPDVAW